MNNMGRTKDMGVVCTRKERNIRKKLFKEQHKT
jgi:hypothetical protein